MKQHFAYFAKCLLNVPTYECCVIIGWPHNNRIFQMVSEYPACSSYTGAHAAQVCVKLHLCLNVGDLILHVDHIQDNLTEVSSTEEH